MNAIELAAIRELFPDDDLYYIRIADDDFIIKSISPKEYATILEISVTEYDEQDLLTQVAIVYPREYNALSGPAGVPKVLSSLIREISLLGNDYKKFRADLGNAYIEDVNTNVEAQIPIIIKTAFTEFTFEQIESWTIDKLLRMFARALWALQLRGIDMSHYSIEYREEVEKTMKEKEAEIRERGGDPVLELYAEYKPSRNVIDMPFIMGKHWRNEELTNATQIQLHRQKR